MTIEELQGKKVVVVGAGLNNQHLVDFLHAKSVKFDLIENWKSWRELDEKIQEAEIIFRTPGLPYKSEPIKNALKFGAQVYSQTKFFFDLCPCPIIGVTGTKGKGTTASLIAKIIEAQGKTRVWLAGNIGQDPFEFVDQIKSGDLVVLELSSFQLQDLHKSPHIAVILNISLDHVDETKTKRQAIHYSFDEYVKAKSQILANQTKEDFAVLGQVIPERLKTLGKAKRVMVKTDDVADFSTRLLGVHNQENIAMATAVAKLLKIPESTIRDAVSTFQGLPYRLQDLGESRGVRVINDGLSTTPIATIAAINSFRTSIILIIGGFDKGVDYSEVGKTILNSKHVKALVIIGQETEKILQAVKGFSGAVKTRAKDIQEIVSQAFELAEKGDTIVFSPGTSSFDMFRDEFDRSKKFEQGILKQ
jgi:UDP-N-acetylmuramoylalanine--D-glutamate ligase